MKRNRKKLHYTILPGAVDATTAGIIVVGGCMEGICGIIGVAVLMLVGVDETVAVLFTMTGCVSETVV